MSGHESDQYSQWEEQLEPGISGGCVGSSVNRTTSSMGSGFYVRQWQMDLHLPEVRQTGT